jgi:hypothetical protein
MKEALLRNPFDAVEASGKPARTRQPGGDALDAGLLALSVRRHRRPGHGAVEQRNPGMGIGLHVPHSRALQSLQRRLRHQLAVAELSARGAVTFP